MSKKNNITLNQVVFFGKVMATLKKECNVLNFSFMGYNEKSNKTTTKVVLLELGIFFEIEKQKNLVHEKLEAELDKKFHSILEDVFDYYSHEEIKTLEEKSKKHISNYWEIFEGINSLEENLSKVFSPIVSETKKNMLPSFEKIISGIEKVFLEKNETIERLEQEKLMLQIPSKKNVGKKDLIKITPPKIDYLDRNKKYLYSMMEGSR